MAAEVHREVDQMRHALRSCGLEFLAILIGVGWGAIADSVDLHVWPLTAILAVGLMGAAGLKSGRKKQKVLVYLGLFGYTLALFLIDPFLYIDKEDSALVGVVLIVPLLLAIPLELRLGDRLATCGTMLFLISSVAAMIHNSRAVFHGVGLWGGWAF